MNRQAYLHMVFTFAMLLAGVTQNIHAASAGEQALIEHMRKGGVVLMVVSTMLAERLKPDNARLLRWFGEFSSESRSGAHTHPPEARLMNFHDLAASLSPDSVIAQSPAAKFLFSRHDDAALLFVDGASYTTSLDFALALTNTRELAARDLLSSLKDPGDEQVLLTLYNNGCLLLR